MISVLVYAGALWVGVSIAAVAVLMRGARNLVHTPPPRTARFDLTDAQVDAEFARIVGRVRR